jgi:hypothetical protein
MKRRRIILFSLALMVVAAMGGRFYAWQAARAFGQRLAGAFSFVSRDGFADTAALRGLFAEPEMAGYARRVRQFSFLGGGYEERLNELQTGMIYFSEQMSLPPERRFAAPPKLKYLPIETADPTDKGVGDAASKLILDYRTQF